ncbi:MAG: hypothetical protein IT249_06595 [Chitinophagaceae bacterium]|nr:hypothetical protein [Chitinophagaceae bacterium]
MSRYTTFYFKLISVFAIVFSLSISSCKKDKNEDTQPTKKELLSNSWKITDIQASDGTSIIGLPVPEITCFKDNIFTMKSDNSYVIDEGAVVCSNSYAGTGTWALTSNDTKIAFTPTTGDGLTITLISVDATTLKASYELTNVPLPGTYTVTLKKI